ncbi:hypothetical protein E2C01_066199 [Portunus trituberculatus]|uniref:Uncharacterized protein n=1 Tax=Portunus trituberculatus TaxID=210409 RepID=A0A5B7HRN7_PORTR|nr:hypothetical protein [Portunus trituberculatus]
MFIESPKEYKTLSHTSGHCQLLGKEYTARQTTPITPAVVARGGVARHNQGLHEAPAPEITGPVCHASKLRPRYEHGSLS